MNYSSLIRMLSFSGLIYAGAMVICALAAMIIGETAQLLVFITTAVLMATVSAAAMILAGTPKRRAQPSDGLAFMVLFWFVSPLICAPPFLMGVANSSVITAIPEAVSCLTTTGHTAFLPEDLPMPASLVMWRALLHLIGAVATITFAATILAALNLDGPGIHRTYLFSLSERSFFDSIPRVLRATLDRNNDRLVHRVANDRSGEHALARFLFGVVAGFAHGLPVPTCLLRAARS